MSVKLAKGMNKKSNEIIVKNGMVREIAKILSVSEKTVYNALRGLTKGKKSKAVRQLATKKMQEYEK